MITPAEAVRLVLDAAGPVADEPVWIWEAAGKVLAADVATLRDLPPFDRSAMDGYAVRSTDVAGAPVELAVTGLVQAGQDDLPPVGPGGCVKIMTGASLPPGADAVVKVEATRPAAVGGRVTVLEPVSPGENVHRRGVDARAGQVVLPAGTRLDGPALSVAAAVGRSRLPVHPVPEVAVVQTGDELLEPGEPAVGNRIYNSHAALLAGLLHDTRAGRMRHLGVCPDEPERLLETVRRGLQSRVLLLTGGVSKGDFDLVPAALEAAGVTTIFRGVLQKPGRPLLFGAAPGGRFAYGLPGNPQSVMVCFMEYVVPLLRRLAGDREVEWPELVVRLDRPVAKRAGFAFLCPARIRCGQGRLTATPLPGAGSGDFVTAARANGVLVLPEESRGSAAGDEVTVRLWRLPAMEER